MGSGQPWGTAARKVVELGIITAHSKLRKRVICFMSFLGSGITDEGSQSKIREAGFFTPFPRLWSCR